MHLQQIIIPNCFALLISPPESMGELVKRFIAGLPNQLKLWLMEMIDTCNDLLLTFKDFAKVVIAAANNLA